VNGGISHYIGIIIPHETILEGGKIGGEDNQKEEEWNNKSPRFWISNF
jgi:hypothetical protein